MEKRQETYFCLNSLTCLMLGKIAHIEDMIAIATIQAEELLADIKSKQTIS
jgi:hypothetical protein